jgi:hypothetical protein
MRRRRTLSPSLIVIPLALSAIALFAALVVLMATEKRVAAAAPDYRVVGVGGIDYEAMQGRPIHPQNAVDRRIVKGLSTADRRTPAGTILFGAFFSVSNDSSRVLRTAGRIELRNELGRVYRPVALPASNPYAYRARAMRPGIRLPSVGSPADDDLAATGLMLLFRVPAADYEDGVLELVIHDPLDPAQTASLRI